MAQLKDTKITGALNQSSGHIYLTGANASSSTGNTTQLVFGTLNSNHVVISSNEDALVINPDTSTTTNQIVLYLNSQSKFPSGISCGTLGVTGNITASGSLTVGDIPNTLKNLCSNGAANTAPGYVLGFNTNYVSSGYTTVANLRNTMGAPLMVSDGNYYTLAAPNGSAISWLRTPTSGLIPYASGGASSNLGSSTWPFNITYTNRVISKNFLTGSFTMAATADAVSSATVTFSEAMTGTPRPMAIASSSVPNTVREITVDTVSSTGFKCYEYRTNGTDNTIYWMAYYR